MLELKDTCPDLCLHFKRKDVGGLLRTRMAYVCTHHRFNKKLLLNTNNKCLRFKDCQLERVINIFTRKYKEHTSIYKKEMEILNKIKSTNIFPFQTKQNMQIITKQKAKCDKLKEKINYYNCKTISHLNNKHLLNNDHSPS